MVCTIDKQSEVISVRADVAKRSNVETLARKTMDARIDGMTAAIEAGISPLQVADQVFEAIRKERFYILTEPGWIPVVYLKGGRGT
jgi:hypothetical protein